MSFILSSGIILLLTCLLAILILAWNKKLLGSHPVSLPTFIAILFTSGLDMGLIIFPLTEFPKYASDLSFQSLHPLALEIGFWGFYVWGFYFVTAFYFSAIEPKLQFFSQPLVRKVHNIVIVGTCAYTGYLFLFNMQWYLPQVSFPWLVFGVGIILIISTYSSTDIRYVKVLSILSSWMFLALCFLIFFQIEDRTNFLPTLFVVGDYFKNLDHFIFPMNEHHRFYLFWWFAWCLMTGQFVARFLGGLKTYQIFIALVLLPSIPLVFWFSILYLFYIQKTAMTPLITAAMTLVGIIFVINSVDSLVRLYSDNLGLTVKRLGRRKYVLTHTLLLFALVMAFTYTPLNIEWVGAVVIFLIAGAIINFIYKTDLKQTYKKG